MKLGASIFPRKIIPIEESLEYFESNKYIDYMENPDIVSYSKATYSFDSEDRIEEKGKAL